MPVAKNQLREIREDRMHLTLSEVALLMQCDSSTVSRHESGDRALTPAWVARYARLYKVESWMLFLNPTEAASAGLIQEETTGVAG
jgi:plasmid maintenance system antidote protein VapI